MLNRHKNWLVHKQTTCGKDYSNMLIADSLLKPIWFINAPCYGNEALASPKANGISLKKENVKEENLHGMDKELETRLDGTLSIRKPVKIIDRKVQHLKQSRIPIVKVRWNSRSGPEFTWEHEDQMQKMYPHLFVNSAFVAEVAP
ncbi:hypothetical protein Tco_1541802 [Tanacetum coccineum]